VSERVGDWCQVYGGRQFWPFDPRPEDVRVEDVAHALALQCRFGGHCREHYSIAQHSVLVSHVLAPLGLALVGLLHDASEAYLVDVPRPIKRAPGMEAYRRVGRDVQAVINRRFGLPPLAHELSDVHDADEIVLATEARDLMAPPPRAWDLRANPLSEQIVPWTWRAAEARFLARFAELTGGARG
jgi:hypothetical protein